MTQDMWMQLVSVLIPILTPLLTAGVRKILPKLPKLAIVVLSPIIGIIASLLTGFDATTGLALGAAGIGVRELYDQTGKAVGLIAKKEAPTLLTQ